MTFVTIGALAIAFFVAAPLAAHLLRRRKAEDRPFPAAHLVPPTPPAARRRSMLEDRALFSIRMLAVLLLAALGATPFVRCSQLALSRQAGASVAMTIVLDDSLSMRAPLDAAFDTASPAPRGTGGRGPTRFDRAVTAARELTSSLNAGDAVAIVLAGAPARVVLASTSSMAAVAATLDAMEPSDRATDLDGAIQLGRSLLRGVAQRDKRVVVLSDLADGTPESPPIAGDADIAVWLPLPELSAHGEDCGVTRANRTGTKVWARVVCTSAVAAQGDAKPASAAVSGDAKPSAVGGGALTKGPSAGRSIEVRAGAKVIAATALGPAIRAEEVAIDIPADAPDVLRVTLTGSDAIAEDDEAPVVAARGALPTAVVVDTTTSHVGTGGPPPIEQAFAALDLDAQVRPLPSVPEHEAELNAFAALIVDDAPGFTPEVRRAIAAWVERGGVVLLTLGPRAAAAPLGAGFEPLVPGVVRWGATPSPGVDPASASIFGSSAPGLADLNPHGRAALDAAASEGADVLARWKDGAPFLLRRSLGRGAVLTLTLPLSAEESDLVLRPAFLALLDRFVSTARARGGARRIDVGETWTFDGYRDVSVRRVSISGINVPRSVAVAEVDRRLRAAPPFAGLYELTLDGEATTRVAAVPDREIDLRVRGVRDEVHAPALGGVASSLDASPYLALALLGLLAVELLLRALGQRAVPEAA